jgi:hypothetical protein
MSEMKIPEWADNHESRKALDVLENIGCQATIQQMEKVINFSTFFAEYEVRGDTLLLHLFPRDGEQDRYYPSEVRDDKRIPGRLELDISSVRFPRNIQELIKRAVDAAWMGDVAIEDISLLRYNEGADIEEAKPEEINMGAYVVQLQGVKNTAVTVGVGKFVDKICEKLDQLLE